MHCYTLVIGGVPERGISIDMHPDHKVPGIALGPEGNGAFVPIDEAWFYKIISLQSTVRSLPEYKGVKLGLPLLAHCDLVGDTPEQYRLVSRPGSERDARVLVRLIAPEGERVRYTGCHKVERFDETQGKVTRNYPRIDDVVGMEYVAGQGGDTLLMVHPGATFRAVRQRRRPNIHVYMLIVTSTGPKIKDLTRRRHGTEPQAA